MVLTPILKYDGSNEATKNISKSCVKPTNFVIERSEVRTLILKIVRIFPFLPCTVVPLQEVTWLWTVISFPNASRLVSWQKNHNFSSPCRMISTTLRFVSNWFKMWPYNLFTLSFRIFHRVQLTPWRALYRQRQIWQGWIICPKKYPQCSTL